MYHLFVSTFVNSFIVTEIESVEKQRETEKQQEITSSLTLQLKERDEQIEELKQSLNGKYYSRSNNKLNIILLNE